MPAPTSPAPGVGRDQAASNTDHWQSRAISAVHGVPRPTFRDGQAVGPIANAMVLDLDGGCGRGGEHHLGHRLQLAAAPLVAGAIGWRAVCACRAAWSGSAADVEAAAAAACRAAGAGSAVASRSWRTRNAGRTIPAAVLSCDPMRLTRLPAQHGGDGYTVASDGSWRAGTGWWAWVTDAGWCEVGQVDDPVAGGAGSDRMELAGALRAVSVFPAGSTVRLVVDNQQVAALMTLVSDPAVRVRRSMVPRWVDWARFTSVRNRLCELGVAVTVRWAPRESDPLHRLADRAIRRFRTHPAAAPGVDRNGKEAA